MPLIKSGSDKARQTNIREMIAAGHRPAQAEAAAYRTQRESRKMDGIKPHKHMASGQKVDGQAGNFGVQPFHEVNGGMRHPDRDMKHEPLSDGNRGIGDAVMRGRKSMPAQAHPDHGPHHHRMEPDFGTGGIPR